MEHLVGSPHTSRGPSGDPMAPIEQDLVRAGRISRDTTLSLTFRAEELRRYL